MIQELRPKQSLGGVLRITYNEVMTNEDIESLIQLSHSPIYRAFGFGVEPPHAAELRR